MKTPMMTLLGWIFAVALGIAFFLSVSAVEQNPANGQPTDARPSLAPLSSQPPAIKAVPAVPSCDSLVGNWTYKVGQPQLHQVSLDIGPKTIDGTLTTPSDDALTVRFHAEYTRSNDGLLYGIVHHADLIPDGHVEDGEQQMELKFFAARLVEQPFALRVHVHDSVLMVKNIKLGIASAIADDDTGLESWTKLFIGRYTQRKQKTPQQAVPQVLSSSTTRCWRSSAG
jgi:hypothetical protein